MKRSAVVLCVGALLLCGVPVQAKPGWVQVTSIPLDGYGPLPGHALASEPLPSPIEGITLRADKTDVECKSVMAKFRSGMNMRLFRGRLRRGQQRVIWMMPVHRDLIELDLHCHAVNGGMATMNVGANLLYG